MKPATPATPATGTITKPEEDLIGILHSLRVWLFANNVPRGEDGYYRLELPAGTGEILGGDHGLMVGFALRAPFRTEAADGGGESPCGGSDASKHAPRGDVPAEDSR